MTDDRAKMIVREKNRARLSRAIDRPWCSRHLKNGKQRETIVPSHAIRQNPADGRRRTGVIALAGEREARGKKRIASISSISHASFPHADSACEKRNFTLKICFALARPSTRRRVDRQQPTATRDVDTTRVNKKINLAFFSRLRVNAQGLGLKRSVTTLRGGTLGYAEIVALKVNRPPPPRKARHASRCRDPDGRSPILSIASPLFLTHYLVIVQHYRSRCFFSSSFHPSSLLSSSHLSSPMMYYLYVSFFFFVSARRRIHPDERQARRPVVL